MLLLLVSFAIFSVAWGNGTGSTSCSSQQSLANVTAQLRDIVASYDQQQSSESLTNLLQIVLARQLTRELDHSTPATGNSASSSAANNSCDCNEILSTMMQLVIKSMDTTKAIRNLTNNSMDNTETIRELSKKDMNNKEAISNLTTLIQRLAQDMATADGYRPSPLLHSCEEIKNKWPDSSSDYYTIVDTNGHRRHVYCEMEQVCGSSGWMRVAYLNMTDPSEECPRGFRLYNQNGVRACGRPASSSGGCRSSVQFPTYSVPYSEVCGRVTGYQYYSTDAFHTPNVGINSHYVDGVSLTHGSPRKHIWTFVAGLQENLISRYGGRFTCPCSPGSTQTLPAFVGNDYFCESGSPESYQQTLYPDPLWDGEGCGSLETVCCQAAGLPWFHKRLSAPTSDNIEMRICADGGTNDEDIPVGYYDIYVK